MQTDGNLVIYDKDNKVMWAANRLASNIKGVVMQDDGNLVVYDDNNKVIWARSWKKCTDWLMAGQVLSQGGQLCSPNGEYVAEFQASDGNFVVYEKVRGVTL